MNDRRYGDHDRSFVDQRHHVGGQSPQHVPEAPRRNPSRAHDDPGERFGGPPDHHPAQLHHGHEAHEQPGGPEGAFRGVGPVGYKRSDERISDDLHASFTDHSQLDASGITISVKDGEATLDGMVRSRACKRLAEDLAERVSGLRHVQNNLRVKAQNAGEPSAAAKR